MKKPLTLLISAIALILFTPAGVRAQIQTEFWGMTSEGGDYNQGAIFRTESDGTNQNVVWSFYPSKAKYPYYTHLCEVPGGKLFGMTTKGGAYDMGVIFEYDPLTETYTDKFEFDSVTTGCKPHGSLVLASNGRLYGTTSYGGPNGKGVLFEFDLGPDGFSKKADMNGLAGGIYPFGSMVEAANGKLYGLSSGGGIYALGVLFEYDPATNGLTNKFDFDSTRGSVPYGSLFAAINGKLYGMTSAGGASDNGVLFEYDPVANTLIKKVDFLEATLGKGPQGSLVQTGNGKIYGLTFKGGTHGYGTLIEYDPISGMCNAMANFLDTVTGKNPTGSLMDAGNGKLYGMTSAGAPADMGTLFSFDTSTNTLAVLHEFDGAFNGRNPYGSLMITGSGKCYGMAHSGGLYDIGLLFEFDILNDTLIRKFDFGYAPMGAHPGGSLMQTPDEKLYGYTGLGGDHDRGTLFSFDPALAQHSIAVHFDNTNNGANPAGNPILALNGQLYGVTENGGINDAGVLFEYAYTTGTFNKLIDFDGTNTGAIPSGSLVQASNGKLYGMTQTGGNNGLGVLYSYDYTADTLISHIHFDGILYGGFPIGSLLALPNGKLFGVASKGGTNNNGVLFKYDVNSGTFTKLWDFDTTLTGSNPAGYPVAAVNGKIYGMTNIGGIHDMGVIYEYDTLTGTLTKKADFDGTTKGSYPAGDFLAASNNKLYGMTPAGGINDMGVLFEFDPQTGSLTKKLDFDGSNGRHPGSSHLIEVCLIPVLLADVEPDSVCQPEQAFFTVTASGNSLSYQWQENAGSGFANILNNSQYSGANNDSLVISNPSAGMNGYMYRCLISSTCPVVSFLSGEVSISVFPQVNVSFSGLDSLYCINHPTVQLAGSPPGGTYSGPGIDHSQFFPSLAGAGTHQIIYSFTNDNNCTYADTQTVVINLCTEIAEETSTRQIHCYPNPAGERLYISFTGSGFDTPEIIMRNIFGQIVFRKMFTGINKKGIAEIDLGNVSAGLYFIEVLTDSILHTARIMISRD